MEQQHIHECENCEKEQQQKEREEERRITWVVKRTYMRVGRDVDKMEVACDGLLTLQDSRCTTFTPEENIRHSDVKSTENKV